MKRTQEKSPPSQCQISAEKNDISNNWQCSFFFLHLFCLPFIIVSLLCARAPEHVRSFHADAVSLSERNSLRFYVRILIYRKKNARAHTHPHAINTNKTNSWNLFKPAIANVSSKIKLSITCVLRLVQEIFFFVCFLFFVFYTYIHHIGMCALPFMSVCVLY